MPTGLTLLPIQDVVARLSVSKSTVYELMAAGELRYVKIGARRLVPSDAVDDYIRSLSA